MLAIFNFNVVELVILAGCGVWSVLFLGGLVVIIVLLTKLVKLQQQQQQK